MKLQALQNIADGIVSLAELERKHPVLGRNFKDFVDTINHCCRKAYKRLSTCLDDVLKLPSNPSDRARNKVLKKLLKASDSKWFRDVAFICDDLAAVATKYDKDIRKHISDLQGGPTEQCDSLFRLLTILHKHEGDLKDDIRRVVDRLKVDLADSKIAEARQRALTIKDEIAKT